MDGTSTFEEMGASFTKTIWEEQHLVTLRSTEGGDVKLLDVLVKGDWGRELLRIGSITNLGSHFLDAASDLDDEDYDDKDEGRLQFSTLKEDLEKFTSQGKSSSWLKLERLPDWNIHSESLTSLLGNLLDWAKATFNFETAKLCRIQNIKSETADLDTLRQFFTAHDPALWTPDIPEIQRLCNLSRSGNLELWVVSKKVYVGSIIYGRRSEGGAGVTVPMPLTGPILPLAAPLGVEAEHRRVDYVEVEAPSEMPHGMPVGFQAIRLKYNVQDGRLVRHRPDMGKKRLTKRDADGETLAFDDPAKDAEYMRDLLLVHEEELDAPRVLNQHPSSSEGPLNSEIAQET